MMGLPDGRLIQLIRNLLDAGYMEEWKTYETLSGCPQGGIISPILSNIYLDKLDMFVENGLIPNDTKGVARGRNPEYMRLNQQAFLCRKKGDMEKAARLKEQMQQIPSMNPHDPNYRRLYYMRYADDFLLGFAGPREEAEEIKQQLGQFLLLGILGIIRHQEGPPVVGFGFTGLSSFFGCCLPPLSFVGVSAVYPGPYLPRPATGIFSTSGRMWLANRSKGSSSVTLGILKMT